MNKLELTRFPELDYAVTEAVNTLCMNMTFMGEDKRVIMMTSCQAGEGKSFMTLCMHRTLAQLGYKVALLDMDLRRSQISSKYGMKIIEGEKKGMTHYLAGLATISDVLFETDVPGAHIIPVGQTVNNSLPLLHSAHFSELIRQMKRNYDFVLLDTPPVGVIIDAAEIAKYCEGVIFTVAYNKISRKELMEAESQIKRTGCEILGTVLNEVSFDSLSSKKYYHKSYYYHYSSGYYQSSKRQKKTAGK